MTANREGIPDPQSSTANRAIHSLRIPTWPTQDGFQFFDRLRTLAVVDQRTQIGVC